MFSFNIRAQDSGNPPRSNSNEVIYYDFIFLQQLYGGHFANLTVIGLYFSSETVIFAFYRKFPMSPYSTNDVRLDLFLGLVSEMESRYD